MYGLCADLVTRFRDKLHRDQFLDMKVKLTISFFVVSLFVFIIVGGYIDNLIKIDFYEVALHGKIETIAEDFKDVQNTLFVGRVIRLLLSVLSAYFIVSYLMRSLRRSSELQKNFASTVSHQLRTPLAVMQNGLEVALRKKESLTTERVEEILQDNLEETKRLSDIINFLLDFSKISNRRKSLMMSKISLSEIANEAKDLLSSFAEKKNIKVVIENETEEKISGNAVALHELVVNLLKNSISYMSEGGLVKIQIKNELKKVCLLVIDNGPGISDEDLAHIFEPFYQGVAGKSSEARGGVGLGLSIVKEIAYLHKAIISVKSEEGRGTTFRVCFNES